MSVFRPDAVPAMSSPSWLRAYYFTRAAVSVGWIAVALTLGGAAPYVAALLLILYPAWDAVANYVDARRSGGLAVNPSQALNLTVSTVTTFAVVVAVATPVLPVLPVFGVWAILSGLFQLVTGLRRWKAGGQWAMVLSGAQSVLAGLFFFAKAAPSPGAAAAAVAPYAGFGAFYFLVSAAWLTVKSRRTQPKLA